MIYRVGKAFVAPKHLDKKHPAVFVKSVCHPHREKHTNKNISCVGCNNDIHISSFQTVVCRFRILDNSTFALAHYKRRAATSFPDNPHKHWCSPIPTLSHYADVLVNGLA